MPPTSGEIWDQALPPEDVDIDILLPNFFIMPITVKTDDDLEKIKATVWKKARQLPNFENLSDKSCYNFQSVTKDAKVEEFCDETRRLCDLRLFRSFLKLVDRKGDHSEEIFQSELSTLVGPTLNEFTAQPKREESCFRLNMFKFCSDIVKKRYNNFLDIENTTRFLYPARLDKTSKDIFAPKPFFIKFRIEDSSFTKQIDDRYTPSKIVKVCCEKVERVKKELNDEDYVLKVFGSDEYLIHEKTISHYRYIRMCLLRNIQPEFVLVKQKVFRETIELFLRDSRIQKPQEFNTERFRKITQRERISGTLSTSYREPQTILIRSGSYVNLQDGKVYVKVALFNGQDQLGKTVQTTAKNDPNWEQVLTIPNIGVCHLPRTTRVAFAICTTQQKKNKGHGAVAWANMNLFDFEGKTPRGDVTIHMWPTSPRCSDALNPLRGVEQNYVEQEKTTLIVCFDKVDCVLRYMNDDEFQKQCESETISYKESIISDHIINNILRQDPVSASELNCEELTCLWGVKNKLRKDYPQSLPLLVRVIPWEPRDNEDDSPFSFYKLLEQWPPLDTYTALQLLSPACTDPKVRDFAVKCLYRQLSDDDVEMYLLQLVQLLKSETYLDNSLTRFLLEKSLSNAFIGQSFFWHLKSEINQNIDCRRRFTLILEVFCRTCGPLFPILRKQMQGVEKLSFLTNCYKDETSNLVEQQKIAQDLISKHDCIEALQNIRCSVKPEVLLQDLQVTDSKVMGSKKRPVRLCWKIREKAPPFEYGLIFKNGDDLRQDMLTLQALQIMNKIWQQNNYDCRMNAYGCLSTGRDNGWIEVVQNAKTVTQIQKNKGILDAAQVKHNALHNWIRKKNTKDEDYEIAVANFQHSCAAYCVATFILGIGDRHPDNIMVTEKGMVFHIDFGHFLDHRKKKFGIQRERVPFVLTSDFMAVIGKGDKSLKNENNQKFFKLCTELYRIIRREAHLFLTLFMLMIPCGLPELQSIDDLEYLKKTLAVTREEKDAIAYFCKHLKEAYGASWTTKLDWLFHNLAN
ncbi:DgyrCDS11440 [Dimorphilus gyrociliatus]|uniref:DgyrCDS11440 n=1 Tax=Dimorphilus gyrociliatus TaxID=2664684 RepID=A0A7I8W3B9_9ANNE|nr:DgyrCDS11440 [Dimorphilus gyrociliatus]